MKKTSHIQGRIIPNRLLTAQQEEIFEKSLSGAGIIRMGKYKAPAGVIDFNEDDDRDTHWIPDFDNLTDNNGNNVNLANALENAMNAPGLEKIVWNGEFLIVTQYKQYPVIYRIIVSDNTAVRLYARLTWNPPIPMVIPWDFSDHHPGMDIDIPSPSPQLDTARKHKDYAVKPLSS